MNAGEIAICTHAYINGHTFSNKYSNKYTRAHPNMYNNPQKYKHTQASILSHTFPYTDTHEQTFIHTHAHYSVLMSLLCSRNRSLKETKQLNLLPGLDMGRLERK